jgi:hypothetical protein
MNQVLQNILDEGLMRFQRGSMERAKDSLIFIIEWFKRVHQYAEMDESEQVMHTPRNALLVPALETMQRELKVLTALVDNTLRSVKNSTNARPSNPTRPRPSPKT